MIGAAKEAMRIVRSLDVQFPDGPPKAGSAFLAPAKGKLLTCAHVVTNQGKQPSRIVVRQPSGKTYEAKLLAFDTTFDLASLETQEAENQPSTRRAIPDVGEQILFAGSPQGVTRPSVFPGMVSAVGSGLISFPKCDLIQIAGMINNGNSGGPLLDEHGAILGLITA